MPTQPIHNHLDLAAQDVFTFGSWGLTLVLVGVAVHMSRRERTPFYLLIVLAAMVAAFAEPLYDEAFSLYFYSTDGMHTHFTAFGVPQPVWTHSGYALLYATPALFMCRRIQLGTLTQRGLLKFAGVEFLMSSTFEIIGVNVGVYTYWGPHVLRILDYPLIVPILETAQVMCFAIAASVVRRRARGTLDLLALFVVFPCTFFLANVGAGAAVVIAIHAEHTTQLIVTLGTLVSILCAVVLVRLAASFLPTTVAPQPQPQPLAAPDAGVDVAAPRRPAAVPVA
jgi:hypothetical protein